MVGREMRHVGGREHPGSQRRRCGGSREPAAWGQCCERTAAGPPGPPAWAERHACLAWRAPCLPAWWTAAPGKTRGRPPRPRAAPHLSAVRPLSHLEAPRPGPGSRPTPVQVQTVAWRPALSRPSFPGPQLHPQRGRLAKLAHLDGERTEGRSRPGSPPLASLLSASARASQDFQPPWDDRFQAGGCRPCRPSLPSAYLTVPLPSHLLELGPRFGFLSAVISPCWGFFITCGGFYVHLPSWHLFSFCSPLCSLRVLNGSLRLSACFNLSRVVFHLKKC